MEGRPGRVSDGPASDDAEDNFSDDENDVYSKGHFLVREDKVSV